LAAPRPSLTTRLTSARLVLRPARTQDTGELCALARKNKTHLAPWNPLPARGEDPSSLTVVARSVAVQRAQWREGRAFPFLVVERKPEPRIVGRINLNAVVRGAFHNAYLGYWIDASRQGQGLMTEATQLVLGFAFGDAGLHRVQVAIMPRNAPSLKVVEKIGFRKEGFALRYLQIAGRWEDHLLFAMTSEEWAERQTSQP
jgi:ribosomal-protein-alanine N-acetyltransferase